MKKIRQDLNIPLSVEGQKLSFLLSISKQASKATDIRELSFFVVSEIVRVITAAEAASLFFVNEDSGKIEIEAWAGFDDDKIKGLEFDIEGSQAGRVFKLGRPEIIHDVSKDPHYRKLGILENESMLSQIAVPLKTEEHTIGIIFADNLSTTHAFSEQDLRLLDSIGDQLVGLFEKNRLIAAVNEQAERIAASEKQYRNLFNSMLNGMALHEIVFDESGKVNSYRFLDVNSAYERMVGLDYKDIVGKTVYDIFPTTRKQWIDRYSEVALKGQPIRFEEYSRALDKHFEIFAFSPQKNQFATIFSEITERKRLHQLIEEERDKAERYLTIAGVMIVVLDESGNITLFNKKSEDILGYKAEEVLNKHWFSTFLPSDESINAAQIYNDFLDGKEGLGEEFTQTVLTKSDEQRTILWKSTSIKNEQGKIVGSISSGEDITEMIRVQTALKNSEERLRNIIENSTNMFYSHTNEHIFTFISPQCKEMLGYRPEEMMRNWMEFTTDHPINQVGHRITEQALSTGERQAPYELELSTKDGGRVWVEVREAPVIEGGKVVGMVGSINDITTRKNAEKEKDHVVRTLQITNEDLRLSISEVQRTMEATIRTLAKTVEARDPYTAGHHKRVSQLALMIAGELELDDEILKAVELAAVIHDIGKIKVPAEILSKPGKLLDIEYRLVKTHPQVGYDLLKDISFPWPLAEIIYQHHERIDGSGYPRGLKNEDLIIEAKILAVADQVEAMSSHRPYRPALGVTAALDQLKLDREKTLDPEIVDACLSIFRKGFTFSSE